MQQNLLIRFLLIVVVLALCGLLMYPLEKKLKPGLDLAGGFELIYQVNVPEDQDSKTVLDQVIATLRKRIDPSGVMNLVWRPQAGNRIEIQCAAPPKKVKALRQTYVDQRKAFFDDNVSRRQLLDVLRLDGKDRRDAGFEALAAGSEEHLELFAKLAEAHNQREAAKEPYEQEKQLLEVVEQQLAAFPDEADDEQRQAVETQKTEVLAELARLARKYIGARAEYDRAMRAALAGNISQSELDQILAMPNKLTPRQRRRQGDDAKTLRRVALDKLIDAHTGRSTAIEALADTYAAYEEYKGRLDDPEDLIAMLKGSGVLEFRIAASPDEMSEDDRRGYLSQLEEKGPRAGREKPYRWMVIDDIAGFTDRSGYANELQANAEEFFRKRHRLVGQGYADDYYVLLGNKPETSLTQAQPDWALDKAWPGMDRNGLPAVMFHLNAMGGHLMGDLTGEHVEWPMAIVLDERVISTPTLQSRIHDSGQITGGAGGFSQQELSYLIRTLNAGTLQGRLEQEPISKRLIGAQLGEDNLDHGVKAAIWALVIVAGFMAFYYFFWGGVADFALFANMIIILGVMSLLEATFTLPGIAGIVLTIGMAVDANVLIFERVREELAGKADMSTAIRLGFEKAFSTIIDANVTTLITCVVLYYTATAEIKGFALTLGIGIVATLFTALFCSRTLIEIYIKFAGARGGTMLPMAVPAVSKALSPNVDWVGKRKVFLACSIVLILGGLFMAIDRGEELLDIEFRSGTKAGITLKDPSGLSLDEVRSRLDKVSEELDMSELAGQRASVVTVGKKLENGNSVSFAISILNEDSRKVAAAIRAAFPDELIVDEPIQFAGSDAENIAQSPARKIEHAQLGANISRPDITQNIQDYLGGVAIVLDKLDPPATEEDLTKRIERMRNQVHEFADLGARQWEVFGLDAAESDAGGGDGIVYRSAVVVSRDELTSYIEEPDSFLEDAKGLAATEWHLVREAMVRESSLDSVSNFSSQVSSTMKFKAVQAMVLSLLAVVAYIWLRFGSLRYGLAAIFALVHDVAIALGMVAIAHFLYDSVFGQALMLTDFKINIAMVAALLTIVGYSLNDTIVVFDRIRENRGRLTDISAGLVNTSINQTISRTVITSGTTLIAVVTLYIFGGDGVHGFAFALIIGVLVGTYSSVAIAAPTLLFGKKKNGQPAKPAVA